MKLDIPTLRYLRHIIERVGDQRGGMNFWMNCNGYYTLMEIEGALTILESHKDIDINTEMAIVEQIAKDMDEYQFLNDIGKEPSEAEIFDDMGIEVSQGPLDPSKLSPPPAAVEPPKPIAHPPTNGTKTAKPNGVKIGTSRR